MKRLANSPSVRALAAPVVANRVAIPAVPLAPSDRKVADLIAALAEVPRFGNQLHAAQRRVLVNDVEEGRQPIDFVEAARQRRRQVEAEAVDVHLLHPVAQRVHHQHQRVRMTHVQAVAGAGVVHVVARVGLDRAVVRAVVDALQVEHRPEMIAFAGVVVDDVEDHFEAGGVKRLHHLLELAHLSAAVALRGVFAVRREVPVGVIAPVVAQAFVEQVLLVDELVDRQQLDRGHAERGQVLDGGRMREAGVRAAHGLRHRRDAAS